MSIKDLTEEERYQIYQEVSLEFLIEDIKDEIEYYEDYYDDEEELNKKLVKYLYDEAESIAFDIHADKEYGCLSISNQYFLDEYIKRYIKMFEEENGI